MHLLVSYSGADRWIFYFEQDQLNVKSPNALKPISYSGQTFEMKIPGPHVMLYSTSDG